jgi:hypothetical protein
VVSRLPVSLLSVGAAKAANLPSRVVEPTDRPGRNFSTHRCTRRLPAGIPQTVGRAYAPVALITTDVLEVERREVQLVSALRCRERDGKVMDREAGIFTDA